MAVVFALAAFIALQLVLGVVLGTRRDNVSWRSKGFWL